MAGEDEFLNLLAAIQAEDEGLQSLFPESEATASPAARFTSRVIMADYRMPPRRKRRKIARWPFPLTEAGETALLSSHSKRLMTDARWSDQPVVLDAFLDGESSRTDDESSEVEGRGKDSDELASQDELPPCPIVTVDQSPLLYQVLYERNPSDLDLSNELQADLNRAKCQRALQALSKALDNVHQTAVKFDKTLNWKGFLLLARQTVDTNIIDECERRLGTIFPDKN